MLNGYQVIMVQESQNVLIVFSKKIIKNVAYLTYYLINKVKSVSSKNFMDTKIIQIQYQNQNNNLIYIKMTKIIFNLLKIKYNKSIKNMNNSILYKTR